MLPLSLPLCQSPHHAACAGHPPAGPRTRSPRPRNAVRTAAGTVLRTLAAGLLACALGLGAAHHPALAADPGTGAPPLSVSEKDREAALQPRLAYVLSGSASADHVSETGLTRLTDVLALRTSAKMAPPVALDPERDDPLLFPVVYWPVSAAIAPLSPEAAGRFNRYMKAGGLLVIDLGDGSRPTDDLLAGLDIPPLKPMDPTHVLARSFYLLSRTPGRLDTAVAWVATTGLDNDGVSPVVVGPNDWAGAWAVDGSGAPLFQAFPGGEGQREQAFRFGINLVMYALAGSYKGDQVHSEAILDKLENRK